MSKGAYSFPLPPQPALLWLAHFYVCISCNADINRMYGRAHASLWLTSTIWITGSPQLLSACVPPQRLRLPDRRYRRDLARHSDTEPALPSSRPRFIMSQISVLEIYSLTGEADTSGHMTPSFGGCILASPSIPEGAVVAEENKVPPATL